MACGYHGMNDFCQSMQLLISAENNPAFNLALEEFLFENEKEDYLLIYVNDDAVICGKHQNAVAESNSEFLTTQKIPLLRRFSGGGTVYHDRGNINFSFITSGENSRVIDFKRYANPVVTFLQSKGIDARLSSRNDIMLGEKKISGHAAHSKGKRALHHGTLLYSADLTRLRFALKSEHEKFKSRAVKSVRSSVTNICDEYHGLPSMEKFTKEMANELCAEFDISDERRLSAAEIVSIRTMASSKYASSNWNYGYGPDYSVEIRKNVNGKNLFVDIAVSNGLIQSIDFIEKSTFESAFSGMLGTWFGWDEIYQLLQKEMSKELALELTRALF
ncbi:MAG: lipoate--protein ligase [Vicingaceae bacterium]